MGMPTFLALVAVIVAGTSAACADTSGEDAAETGDAGLIREVRFPELVMGAFGGPAFEDSIPQVERQFWLYETADGGEAVSRLPEMNTLAGRAGPCFFLSPHGADGEPSFEDVVWLEVRARREGEPEFAVLSPRIRLDPDEPLFGITEHQEATAGDMRVYLPCLPFPTCMMLTDYPAGYLEGPGTMRFMLKTLSGGEDVDDAELEAALADLDLPAPQSPRAFDASRWGEGSESDRWDMVQDLVNRHEFLGMTRAEVEALLGSPAQPGFPFGAKHWDIVYKVGSTFMDSFWLFFALDTDGRVSMLRLYED
jgi:hypothetical protein